MENTEKFEAALLKQLAAPATFKKIDYAKLPFEKGTNEHRMNTIVSQSLTKLIREEKVTSANDDSKSGTERNTYQDTSKIKKVVKSK